MRLSTTWAAIAALGAGASVAEQTAQVFILEGATAAAAAASQTSHTQPPVVPKELARHILLQRTTANYNMDFLSDLPSSIDPDAAVKLISTLGRNPPALFAPRNDHRAAQLVVFLEGVTGQNAGPLRQRLADAQARPAFVIADPPSPLATTRLLSSFGPDVVPKSSDCDFGSVVGPYNRACWTASSMVVRYDLDKQPQVMQIILDNFQRLADSAASGELDTTLVLLPESSGPSKPSVWSVLDSTRQVKARDMAEEAMVIASSARDAASQPRLSLTEGQTPGDNGFRAAKKKILHGCLQSLSDCQTQTNNCSHGHGTCRNRNGNETAYGPNECFLCQCNRAVNETSQGRQTTYWAGSMCQKVDKSTPFWLLAGSAIALAGAVAFAIGLLFNVGEEELPGVIGAGVSRSK